MFLFIQSRTPACGTSPTPLPHSGWAFLLSLTLSGNALEDTQVCFVSISRYFSVHSSQPISPVPQGFALPENGCRNSTLMWNRWYQTTDLAQPFSLRFELMKTGLCCFETGYGGFIFKGSSAQQDTILESPATPLTASSPIALHEVSQCSFQTEVSVSQRGHQPPEVAWTVGIGRPQSIHAKTMHVERTNAWIRLVSLSGVRVIFDVIGILLSLRKICFLL